MTPSTAHNTQPPITDQTQEDHPVSDTVVILVFAAILGLALAYLDWMRAHL